MEKLNFKEIYEIEHLQNGLSYSKIREKYNIKRGTWDYYVRKILNLSCDLRKTRMNDTFFDVIDTEEKAYLLGFLYADGYLASDGRIGMRLSIKDQEIIYLIKKYICPDNKIELTNNQNIKRSPQISIRFKSKRIYQRLLDLGFCVDKTHTETNIFDNIPNNFKIYFIRGYTDGDGCLGRAFSENIVRNNICLSYSNGTAKLLKDINNFLPEKGVLTFCKTYYKLDFRRKQSIKNILYIYKDSNIYLKRKFDIAEKIKTLCNNTELT